jgi:hypothetical protein
VQLMHFDVFTGTMSQEPEPNYIAWARRVNGRWIVHNNLRERAAAYLDYLERNDPDRLERSCRLARALTTRCKLPQDPKPWFYGGLFSLATTVEADQFLSEHYFTAAVIPCTRDNPDVVGWLEKVNEPTRQAVRQIRRELEKLIRQGEE